MSKRVLITGGSRGIGAALVRKYTAEGDSVFFLYNKSEREATALGAATGAKSLSVDVADTEALVRAVQTAARELGGIDVLINNAGVSQMGLLTDLNDDEMMRVYNTDLVAATVACREAARIMVRVQGGYIVNVGSVWGRVGASCEAVYSAAKAGLRGLSMALAKELGPSHITVNCVEPGVIRTDMNGMLEGETLVALVEQTPLCRIGEPQEIAETVYFLTSGKADFITGQCIGVDGGFGL